MSKETITIYRCNQCRTVLSNPEENIATSHLSITIGSHSGWWELIDEVELIWKQTSIIDPGIYHFCGPKCCSKWFNEGASKEHRNG